MFSSLGNGLRAAWRQPKLVLLLWVCTALVGSAVALPMWSWLRGALDMTVEGPWLMGHFNIGALADLQKYSDANPLSLFAAGARGAILLAIVASAFTNGAMLEVLASGDDRRTFMHRFFRGGGHFFWRFFRLMVLAGIAAGVVAVIVGAALSPVLSALSDSEWGYGPYVAGLITLLAVALAAGLFLIALDYARIRVARDDSRGMFRAYAGAVGFVLRHALAAYGMTVAVLFLVGVVLLLYIGHETVWTTTGWATILVLVAVQQVVVLARTGLRVALVGAERHYYLAHQPPVAAPKPEPEPSALVEPGPVPVEDTDPPSAA